MSDPTPRSGPFYLVDFGHGLGDPEWSALARAPGAVGAILKVSQGTKVYRSWFDAHWRACARAGGDRFGATWFRGAYVFGTPYDGARQADVAIDAIEAAGGWGDGDMPLAWDIEGAAWNDDKSLRRLVSQAFAARVRVRTGRAPMLYANGDIGIGPEDGFDTMWTPHPRRLASWPASRFRIYQYAGLNDGHVSYYDPSGPAAARGLPLRFPGFGSSHGVDVNVVLDGHRGRVLTDVRRLRHVLTGKSDSAATLAALAILGALVAL